MASARRCQISVKEFLINVIYLLKIYVYHYILFLFLFFKWILNIIYDFIVIW